MANLILNGVKEGGKDAELINVSNDSVGSVADEDILVLGCPAMWDEELDEGEFVPALEGFEDELSGKKVALFGSYDWGSGEWMD